MTAQQFNFAIVLKADASQGKAGLADFEASLRATAAEAGKTGAAASSTAGYMKLLAAETSKAALTQKELAAAQQLAQAKVAPALIAPLASPQASAAPVVAFWKASETAAASLQNAVSGLNVSIGQQAGDFLKASQAGAAWQRSLDDIRASFNPLYAASRQYEAQVERIAEAERLGAISAAEAAAARAKAASIIAPAAGTGGGGGAISGMNTANVAAQGFDIGVTAAMGMNPMMIGLQQGTQLVQVMQQMGGGKTALQGIAQGFLSILNPMSLATIGIVAFGALGIQALMKLMPETRTVEDALADLADSVSRVGDATARARRSMVDLGKEFGSTAGDAKDLLRVMAEIERRSAGRDARSVLSGISSEMQGGSMLGLRSASDQFGSLQRLFGEAGWWNSGRVSEGASPQSFRVSAALDAVGAASLADDIDKQIAAVDALFAAVQSAAAAYGGLSKEEDAWLQKIGEAQRDLQKLKALDENSAGVEAAKSITRDLTQQVGLERERLQYGADSVEARAVANRQEREALELKLAGMGIDRQSLEGRRALNALTELQYRREQAVAAEQAERQLARQDGIDALRRELALLAASTAEQTRAKAVAEAEIEIRKEKLGLIDAEQRRVDAIARAEAEIALQRARAARDLQTGRIMDGYELRKGMARDPRIQADVEAEQEYVRQIRDGADPALARAEADRVRSRALDQLTLAQDRFLRSQAEGLQRQQLELALLGQSAAVRARVLALREAEQQIFDTGASGEMAETMRRNALAQADLAQVIEAQADAWQRVQSAGEAAIDGVLDKLRGGDVKGAFAELLGEIEKGFFDLAIRNPLKNAILGTNLGTWEDVGGWGGIIGRFSGKAPADEGALARQAVQPLQSMTVTAANVILQGNLSGIGGVANLNAAPMGLGGSLPGSGDVQAQIWQFFAAKGLAAHQIAGIMGNISGESGFNPLAVGDNGTSFGLFQHHAGRGQGLLGAVGGMGGLQNVQAQLEFVWNELLTTERAALERLQAAPTVSASADAWMRGFERPSDEAMAKSWGKRLAAAEQAAAQFGTTVQAAGAQVGQGGSQAAAGLAQAGQGAMVASQGMGAFGQVLSGIGGMVGGKTGSILQTVVGIGGALLSGTPLFKQGGFTGGSDPDRAAGIVHEGEFVFDAAATRRIGVRNLEGIRKGAARGFRSGGYVGPGPGARAANAPAAPMAAPGMLNVSVDVSGARGDREIEAMVQQAVSQGVAQGFDLYDRDVLPARVRQISHDRWSS